MRVAFDRTSIETDQPQEIAGALPRQFWVGAVRNRSVADDLPDLAAWIERGKRILKDHLDAAALVTQCLALPFPQGHGADPDGAAGGTHQPHHQTRDR